MNRKWTTADYSLVIAEFHKGTAYEDIATALGTSKQSIAAMIQWLRASGIDLPLRKNRLDVDALNKIGKP